MMSPRRLLALCAVSVLLSAIPGPSVLIGGTGGLAVTGPGATVAATGRADTR
ncbi:MULTISPECIES: hypothetical protein [unclassified Kitasatospora]|uniref:hypothetical protein n=1 Tax=unclassified Kitasatospora TaxID=2633591 RepID=UPI0033DBBB22